MHAKIERANDDVSTSCGHLEWRQEENQNDRESLFDRREVIGEVDRVRRQAVDVPFILDVFGLERPELELHVECLTTGA